ncbi:MAG: primosomal protein N' [Proteobacteria bacterium]|nr:primosomal protein N' [Pseudomonadota bacterium]
MTAEDARDATESEMGQRRVSVLLPLPLAGAYDYLVPPELALEPGDFVAAPLGPNEFLGVVWGEASGEVPVARLKAIIDRLDVPPLSQVQRRFVDWVAQYTVSPPGAVLRMAMSVSAALEPKRPILAYRRTDEPPGTMTVTPARRRVLALLADGPPRPMGEIAREAGVGTSVVKGLVALHQLEAVELPPPPSFREPDWRHPGPTLSADQEAAATALRLLLDRPGFAVTLLDGVTGSGKTEVYFEAIAAALAQGKQALVLLPEIALSAEWLARFESRFGVAPAAWHSDLTQAERRVTWRAVAEGVARVVVGARSALFLPYPELGLIVVDEEHDGAFKQEDGVIYHARDMAIVRAQLGQHPVVLSSATPSLESLVNVESGRYRRLGLPDRHAGASLPTIEAIDMRGIRMPATQFLSPPLRQAVADTLAQGEQAMLFLNRRGYAPLTLCRTCGHRLNCPNCSTWLVEHRLAGRLQCHHCGRMERLPLQCPACGAEGSLAACGPGVERLAEEMRALAPAARLAVMASDTIGGPAEAAEIVRSIREHEVDIVIGTQMVAKGHNFPMLTLVGVVDADLGLAGGDLRASERTYQLLHQVAGRAGRAERPGRVLMQTYQPGEAVIAALIAGDRDRFIEAETQSREAACMPPFGRLVALIISGHDVDAVIRTARLLGQKAPRGDGVSVLGQAPAPLSLLRGRHRHRLLLKAPRNVRVQPLVQAWLAQVKVPGSVRVAVDIDPYSFM